MLGKICEASQAPPESDEIGTNMPENCTAGRMVMIAAAKIAAVCVLAKTEISRPKPVLARTKMNPPTTSASRLPFTGTPNRKTASATSVTNWISATAT